MAAWHECDAGARGGENGKVCCNESLTASLDSLRLFISFHSARFEAKMRGLCLAAIPALALAHGSSRGSASVRDGVVVPPHGSAMYSLNITASELSSPHDTANVSWSGISEAASGDWIAVCCDQPTGGYYWWQYTSGQSHGFQEMHLWATGLKSGCDKVYVAYYTSGNTVIGESPLIPVRPMIQQVRRPVMLMRGLSYAASFLCRSISALSRPMIRRSS